MLVARSSSRSAAAASSSRSSNRQKADAAVTSVQSEGNCFLLLLLNVVEDLGHTEVDGDLQKHAALSKVH